ncbi:MAG TPA: cyclic nucleotide-binding domain-containing protein [Dongiaceae bacterium]|jgi:CRP-like cAMP-binding protein|nr:cyclic nucleotide-binding domain-containing protein [Dongiaceae bacterium]
MSLHNDVEILRRVPLFAKIELAKLKLLAFASERITYQDGELLFSQGDRSDAAYIVIEGEADILIDTQNGPLTVAHLGKDAIIGEIGILCDVPRTATVRAAKPLTVIRIAKDLFLQMMMDFPAMAIEITRVLAQRLEGVNLQLRNANGRNGTAERS